MTLTSTVDQYQGEHSDGTPYRQFVTVTTEADFDDLNLVEDADWINRYEANQHAIDCHNATGNPWDIPCEVDLEPDDIANMDVDAFLQDYKDVKK